MPETQPICPREMLDEAGEPWTALPFKTGDAGKLHAQAQRLSTGGHHKAAARVRRHRLSLDFVSPCWCAS